MSFIDEANSPDNYNVNNNTLSQNKSDLIEELHKNAFSKY